MQLCYPFHEKKESKEEERLLNRKFPMSQIKFAIISIQKRIPFDSLPSRFHIFCRISCHEIRRKTNQNSSCKTGKIFSKIRKASQRLQSITMTLSRTKKIRKERMITIATDRLTVYAHIITTLTRSKTNSLHSFAPSGT